MPFDSGLFDERLDSGLTGDEKYLASDVFLPENDSEFYPIHLRKNDIEDGQIWTPIREQGGGFFGGISDANFVSVDSEDLSEGIGDNPLVFDDENFLLTSTRRHICLYSGEKCVQSTVLHRDAHGGEEGWPRAHQKLGLSDEQHARFRARD